MFNIIFSKLSKFVLLPTLKNQIIPIFFQINKFGTLKYRTQGISFIFSKRKKNFKRSHCRILCRKQARACRLNHRTNGATFHEIFGEIALFLEPNLIPLGLGLGSKVLFLDSHF